MTVPFPNPTTFEQMQANTRALSERFFPARPAVAFSRQIAAQVAEAAPQAEEPIQEPEDATPFAGVSDRCADVIFAVLDVSGVTARDLYESQAAYAMVGRQVAATILIRAEIETLASAASILGITIGAARAALGLYDPLLNQAALPIRHDPVGCVGRLWLHAIRDLKRARKVASVGDCLAAVREVTGLTLGDIRSERRSVHLVKARQIVMWLAKEHTCHSYPTIGKQVGGRDHTTVMHGYEKVSRIVQFIDASPEWGLREWAAALWAADWKSIQGEMQ